MFGKKFFLPRPEKRNYRRIDCDLPVDLTIEGKKINVNASNISCGGLFVSLKQEIVKERADIEIIVSLPNENKPVKVVGEVARYQSPSFLNQSAEGVAIRFRGLYDDNILAIDRFIKDRLH